MCSFVIKTSSVPPRKSSVIFGNFWKIFGNDCLVFDQLLEILRKCSENFGKSSKKSSFLVQSALLGWLGVDAAKALWRYGTMALWHYGNKV